MPFKIKEEVCKLPGCSVIVDSDIFNGYCSKRHLDIAKLQQTEPDIERPTPLTSVPIRPEGHGITRKRDAPVNHKFNYTSTYTKV